MSKYLQQNYISIGQHSDYNDYYSATKNPLPSLRYKKLYDEYYKKDKELNDIASQYHTDQLYDQVDDKNFRALNDAGDYGYKE